MITATGILKLSTRTDQANLLRNLAAFVDDMMYEGINVEVTVTVGDAPATEPAPFIMPTTPPAPAWTSTTLPPTSLTVHSGNLTLTNGAQPTPPPIALNWDSPAIWGALWPLVEDLSDGSATFRRLEPAARYDLAAAIAIAIGKHLDLPRFTQSAFDRHKPAWCPGAVGLAKTLGYKWQDILNRWIANEPYPNPEVADDDTAPFRATR